MFIAIVVGIHYLYVIVTASAWVKFVELFK